MMVRDQKLNFLSSLVTDAALACLVFEVRPTATGRCVCLPRASMLLVAYSFRRRSNSHYIWLRVGLATECKYGTICSSFQGFLNLGGVIAGWAGEKTWTSVFTLTIC